MEINILIGIVFFIAIYCLGYIQGRSVGRYQGASHVTYTWTDMLRATAKDDDDIATLRIRVIEDVN